MIRYARSAWALVFALAFGPLNSCRRQPADPPPRSSARWVLTPTAIASLSSTRQTRGLPEEIRLGEPFGRNLLYLKFPSDWSAKGRAARAFLTLVLSDGVASDPAPISVEVWRVRSDWAPEELRTWSDKPDLGPPFARAAISAAPARELRIDVTDLLRFATASPERDFGFALLTRGGSGSGAAFSTGVAGGAAPRLEVYVTRTR